MYFVQSQTILSYLKNWKKFDSSKFWQIQFLVIFMLICCTIVVVCLKRLCFFVKSKDSVSEWPAWYKYAWSMSANGCAERIVEHTSQIKRICQSCITHDFTQLCSCISCNLYVPNNYVSIWKAFQRADIVNLRVIKGQQDNVE